MTRKGHLPPETALFGRQGLAHVPYAQLHAFHAVATHRSFTLAAKTLGVSQPAVSMQVRALEEAFGVELVARGSRGAAPTALGAELLEVTRPLLALEAQASELLGAASALLRGQLRVGADAPFLMVPLLAAFRARHPHVELSLSLGNSEAVLRDVLDGRTDVAALGDRAGDPRLFAIPAARSRQVVLVSRAHPWAARGEVKLADLHGAEILVREEGSSTRRAFAAAVARAKVRPRVVMEIGSREALQEAVAAGLGAAVIIDAERGRDDRLVALPIADTVIEHVEYVACLAERRKLRAVAAFLDLVPRLPHGPDGDRRRRRRSPSAR
jgi:aminoethylphosphonate catabolism LysR family transcriptional regulator